ncbi:MAG: TetR/AcrR family transcriptional regulator [Gammaproteobacteria bacterium]|jgi:TetR/AcrR family transcriptional repressor of mexJK operon
MRPDKRREILAAATRLIVARGYPEVSLDAVCENAACSKSAIYGFFGSKDGLLLALVGEAAGSIAQAQHALHLPNLDVRAALRRYAGLLLDRALSAEHVAILKAAIGVGARCPEPVQHYRDVALATTSSALAQFLAAKTMRGDLTVGDPVSAAQQFHALVFAGELLSAVVESNPAPLAADAAIRIEDAVDLFLARYGRA